MIDIEKSPKIGISEFYENNSHPPAPKINE